MTRNNNTTGNDTTGNDTTDNDTTDNDTTDNNSGNGEFESSNNKRNRDSSLSGSEPESRHKRRR